MLVAGLQRKAGLPDAAVASLLQRAIELHGEDLVTAHIQSVTSGASKLEDCRERYDKRTRTVLAAAARTKKAGWFKTVSWMEDIGREIVGPALMNAEREFRGLIVAIFKWISDAPR
jgi:hypothetical protein